MQNVTIVDSGQPSIPKKVHMVSATENKFWIEDANLNQKVATQMLSTAKGKKELIYRIWSCTELNSFDRKLILKLGTWIP